MVATNGMKLNYIPPQIVDGKSVVQLDKVEFEKEVEKWHSALIAYFIRETSGYNMMRRYIQQNLSNVVEPNLFHLDEGYYVVKF